MVNSFFVVVFPIYTKLFTFSKDTLNAQKISLMLKLNDVDSYLDLLDTSHEKRKTKAAPILRPSIFPKFQADDVPEVEFS